MRRPPRQNTTSSKSTEAEYPRSTLTDAFPQLLDVGDASSLNLTALAQTALSTLVSLAAKAASNEAAIKALSDRSETLENLVKLQQEELAVLARLDEQNAQTFDEMSAKIGWLEEQVARLTSTASKTGSRERMDRPEPVVYEPAYREVLLERGRHPQSESDSLVDSSSESESSQSQSHSSGQGGVHVPRSCSPKRYRSPPPPCHVDSDSDSFCSSCEEDPIMRGGPGGSRYRQGSPMTRSRYEDREPLSPSYRASASTRTAGPPGGKHPYSLTSSRSSSPAVRQRQCWESDSDADLQTTVRRYLFVPAQRRYAN